MEPRQIEFLRRLIETPSPSGFEGPAQEIFFHEVSGFCPDVSVDVYGNVVARLEGLSPVTILLAGHCDEIGLIVKHIDDNGFLFVTAVGGVDPAVLLGQRVRLLGPQGPVPGVIGRIPFHLQEKDDKEQRPKIHELWIDIGAGDRVQAERLAPIGTPAVWGEDFHLLLGDQATARDFDNKVGVYVVAETIRALSERSSKPPVTVLGVSTIQEECGVWGAGPVAYALAPTAAIAIDVTHATDYPGMKRERHGEVFLGKGPTVKRGVKSSKVINGLLEETASRYSIGVQIEADSGRFGTDADPMSDRRGGIPVNTLGIPLRYMHTATEVVSLDDVDAAVTLLTEALSALRPDTDFRAFSFQKTKA